MRAIKFRAFDRDAEVWVKNVECQEIFWLQRHKKSMAIMQFTGLQDCNGIEIYESDLVLDSRSINKEPSIVKYAEDKACFTFSGWNIPFGVDEFVKVVGNIYES